MGKQDLLERVYGIDTYYTTTEGLGGKIRTLLEDFIVEEIAFDGSVAEVRGFLSNTLQFKGRSAQGVAEAQAPDNIGPKEYIWFILEKRGLDTLTALRFIAKSLNVDENLFKVAGLKDSKALTAQFVSAYNVSERDLTGFSSKKVVIHSLHRRPFLLKPGMLYGNRFTITIRSIEHPPDIVEMLLNSFISEVREKRGVPAFYGYQRFGTIRPNTHLVGYHLLRGDFESSFYELVCKVYPFEREDIRIARETAAEGRYEEALRLFPPSYFYERHVLRHLVKHSCDYIGAFRKLPHTVRRLFLQAYQAYLFNKVLSRRILLGLPLSFPLPGDYVGLWDKWKRVSSVIRVTASNIDELKGLIKRGKASLVLNVFGYNTILAEGAQGEIEKDVLEEEGIRLEDFRLKHFPEASMKGSFREALMVPEDLSLLSISEDELHESRTKVTIRFVLKRGFYATILLRELMKPQSILTAGF
ncbi:MAG: tRNA pseudouridine(13) synthase TruD [Thermoprotei archaeon]|nr:MAG: tRNA pseudouridine(13) synthase TruD [Thermoprotei archaeon]